MNLKFDLYIDDTLFNAEIEVIGDEITRLWVDNQLTDLIESRKMLEILYKKLDDYRANLEGEW